MPHPKTLAIILGPTAIGKTSTAIKIAQQLSTEIISADSRQFFHGMKIGTAVPDDDELALVKHHFIGNLNIGEYYNVSRYETEVLNLLEQLFKTHKYVLMTGGSGLYIDAVCNGIDDLPDPDMSLRSALKEELLEKGIDPLLLKLKELDPIYYDEVDRNNPNRVLRAIEVCLATGKPFSSLRKKQPKERKFAIKKIGLELPREELFERINRRVDQMMESGLLAEVESLKAQRDQNALNSVGYKELFQYFDGIISLDQAIENIKTNTRRYAKRQLTWFKKDPAIKWIHPQEINEILTHIKNRIINS